MKIDCDFLVFIRHGQTSWNAEGRMQGQRDIPLNSIGETQARRNGGVLQELLAAEGMQAGDLDFVASPLGRTSMTMELVREAMSLPVGDYRREPLLKEITFGEWEGYTIEELAVSHPERIAERRADKWAFTPPNGESYAMLSERIAGWLATVKRPSVVVSHGGVFRVLRGLLEEHPTAAIPKLDVPQDKVFLWKGDGFQGY